MSNSLYILIQRNQKFLNFACSTTSSKATSSPRLKFPCYSFSFNTYPSQHVTQGYRAIYLCNYLVNVYLYWETVSSSMIGARPVWLSAADPMLHKSTHIVGAQNIYWINRYLLVNFLCLFCLVSIRYLLYIALTLFFYLKCFTFKHYICKIFKLVYMWNGRKVKFILTVLYWTLTVSKENDFVSLF